MSNDWTGAIAAERMQLDQEFHDRIEASSFDRQQWGLVMTATNFEIENPSDPSNARLVPDTSSVPTIIPELDRVGQRGPMGADDRSSGSGSGLVDSVKGALGLGTERDEQLEEATRLTNEYSERLQKKIESRGRWESVCERARD